MGKKKKTKFEKHLQKALNHNGKLLKRLNQCDLMYPYAMAMEVRKHILMSAQINLIRLKGKNGYGGSDTFDGERADAT